MLLNITKLCRNNRCIFDMSVRYKCVLVDRSSSLIYTTLVLDNAASVMPRTGIFCQEHRHFLSGM